MVEPFSLLAARQARLAGFLSFLGEGTFVRTDLHVSGSVANSPVVGAFQVVIEFSGSLGTFTVRDQLLFGGRSTGLSGTWQIVSGTGAYERASGHGTSEFIFPNSLTFTGVMRA